MIKKTVVRVRRQQIGISPRKTLVIDGSHLTVETVTAFVHDHNAVLEVSRIARERVQKGKKYLDAEMRDGRILYGVNTGFGPMASHIINDEQLAELQENLIRSHATGMGEPIPDEYVLATMIVRLNTLAKGFSGVSPELIGQFETLINHRIIPIIPEHGAVGTSGDLVQLAHIALALIGEGDVRYQGKRRPTVEVLAELGIIPHLLHPKEGLALINGTSAMTGVATHATAHANRLLSVGVRLGALALEIVNAFDDSISEHLQNIRPHKGQRAIASALRSIVASSKLMKERESLKKGHETKGEVEKISEEVQQVYSLRCMPQILGPIFDTLMKTRGDVQTEMNSVTDNPIIEWKHKKFLHGGNFHGDYIATAMDQLKAAIVKLTMLAERRTNFFLHDAINKRFKPFLNLKTPGLTLGLQGLQFVATSTTAQSQSLAFPHTIHSIPTNADNQDLVSMGFEASMFAARVMENAYVVLAIELITLAQAVDCAGIESKLSHESRMLFDAVRAVFPKVVEDRVIMHQLPLVTQLLKENTVLDVTWDI